MTTTFPISRTATPENPVRVNPVMLAAVVSVVAAGGALLGHLVLGLGETPLVIATLVLASVAGWSNIAAPSRRRRPS